MSQITKKSSYADLKKWFLVRIDVLPKKIDGGYIYYHDVRFTVEVYFSEIENEIKDRDEGDNSIHRRIDEYQVQMESSTDRRFDKVWDEVHKLDKTINPNMDKIKGLTKQFS